MITAAQLAACTGATQALAFQFLDPLAMTMSHFRINTAQRQAMFLPNAGHESGRLAALVENLNYRADRLVPLFGSRRITPDQAQSFGRIDGKQTANQESIANTVYGGDWGRQNLGNVYFGDGWKFRGRGLFQTTGRDNYRRATEKLRIEFPELKMPDFEASPELLAQPLYAALAAGVYWASRDLNTVADSGDFDAVCDIVNLGHATPKQGDSNGFADRLMLFRAAKVALGVSVDLKEK